LLRKENDSIFPDALAQIVVASFYKASSLLKAGSFVKDRADSWK
jgi:hypothetical protein